MDERWISDNRERNNVVFTEGYTCTCDMKLLISLAQMPGSRDLLSTAAHPSQMIAAKHVALNMY